MGEFKGPKKFQGYLATPEGQAAAQAGHKKYYEARRKHKEMVEQAVAASDIGDEEVQKIMINSLVKIASDPTHDEFKWAMEMLVKHGSFKMPEPPKEEAEKKEDMSVEDAAAILKQHNIKAAK